MTKEDFVSFETAKLLKEKGFDVPCLAHWFIGSEAHEKFSDYPFNWNEAKSDLDWLSRPTLQMAMKWLREVHNIYISIQPDFPSDKDYKMCWCCSVDILHEDCISTKWYQCYIETYEKACEAAIKYCLENLI